MLARVLLLGLLALVGLSFPAWATGPANYPPGGSGSGVVANTCTAGDFFSAVDGSGNFTCATPAGSGDVTAVGDCASGACFDGTTGSTITAASAGHLLLKSSNSMYFDADIATGSTGNGFVFRSNNTSNTLMRVIEDGYADLRSGLDLRLYDADDSNYVQLSVPALASNFTATFPAETGTVCTTGSICSGTVTYQAGPLSGDVVTSGAVATIQANSVALTTDTTGNYAAGDAEAGNATGVACTDCVALTTETTGNYAAGDAEAGNATGLACTTCVDATDIATGAVTSAKILDGEIANADVNASAAILFSKLATTNTDRILGRDTAGGGAVEELTVSGGLEFTGTGIQRSALTGDVTASAGSNSTTIAANSVALTTDTTGNYAAGDAEAGAALTGDSATSFFSSGELERTLLPAASADCAANRWAKGVDADFVLDCSQPAFSDISGTAAATQITKINSTSCTNGVQTASDGTVSCLTASSTPEFVSRVMTAGGTLGNYAVVMADGSDDDEVIEATTSTTQILGCSQDSDGTTSTNPVEVAVAGIARCKADTTVTAGSLVKLGATGEFALATTAEKTWGRAVTDDDGAGSAYILLFDGAEGFIDHGLDLWPSIPDITTNTVNMVNIAPSVDITGAGSLYAIRFAPTSTLTGTSSTRVLRYAPTTTLNGGGDLSTFYLLSAGGTITSAPTTASLGPIPVILAHQTTYTATSAGKSPMYQGWGFLDSLTISSSATSGSATTDLYRTIDAGPTVNQTGNGGTLTVTALTGLRTAPIVTAGTGGTAVVTTRRGVDVADVTTSGAGTKTITTNIGVDIAALSSGTTNIGLRNAATSVFTPTTQAIAAATDTITCDTTYKKFTTFTGTNALTSNPSIANGQTGQICILENVDVTGTDCITLTDSTLGMQLSGNFTLCPNDTIMLVYDGTDWIEISEQDN